MFPTADEIISQNISKIQSEQKLTVIEKLETNLEKEMAHLKGFLQGKDYQQSLIALSIAKRNHLGQTRKAGGQYIMHPIRVCSYLAALKVYDDNTLAIALLHDVVEDCNMNLSDLKSYGLNDIVIQSLDVLTKKKSQSNMQYYVAMIKLIETGKPESGLVKLSDRCNNISTMAGAFSPEKIEEYIVETETQVYMLCSILKEYCPKYSDQIFVMKYNLESMIKAYKLFLNSLKQEEK